MHYKELADKARYFKSEEGGLEIMGDVMEKFFAKREKEVKAKAKAKERINIAKEMLSNNEDVEKIVKYSKLSLTEVQKLAKKLSA